MDEHKHYTFKFYNITCYGPNAQSHIFAEDPDIQCIVEHHMPESSSFDLRNNYAVRGYRIFNNPARPSCNSAEGTHGGELIACKKYHNVTSIDPEVFEHISKHTSEPCSLTACLLRLKGHNVLLIALYLWSGQALSDKNFAILKQVRILKDIIKKPALVFGDWNMSPEQLAASGWLDLLGFRVNFLVPKHVTSTMHKFSDRVIDYAIVDTCISHIPGDLEADIDTPFLHLGLSCKINARPNAEHSLVQIKPKKLPHSEALPKYESLNDWQKYVSYRKAHKHARKILTKQKAKTGVAILNKPCGALAADPKFNGHYCEESIRTGERLALASLAAEIHTLQLADIQVSLFHKYIGRGQYPKFMWKPNASQTPIAGKYVCEHATFWSSVYGLIDRIIVERSTQQYISKLSDLLSSVDTHRPSESSSIVLNNLNSIDAVLACPKPARLSAQLAKNHFIGVKVNESSQFWRDYVRRELATGGGKLFKWISSEEKQFLSVNLSAMMPRCISLNKFVQDQAVTWSKLWRPNQQSSDLTQRAFADLWHKARELRESEVLPLKEYFDDKVFYESIKNIKRIPLVLICGPPKVILPTFLSLL